MRRRLYGILVRWLYILRLQYPFGSADCRTAVGEQTGARLGKLELPSVSAVARLFAGDKTLCGLRTLPQVLLDYCTHGGTGYAVITLNGMHI